MLSGYLEDPGALETPDLPSPRSLPQGTLVRSDSATCTPRRPPPLWFPGGHRLGLEQGCSWPGPLSAAAGHRGGTPGPGLAPLGPAPLPPPASCLHPHQTGSRALTGPSHTQKQPSGCCNARQVAVGVPRARGQGWAGAQPAGPVSLPRVFSELPFLPQRERVRQWEARQLWDIEEATQHELTLQDE